MKIILDKYNIYNSGLYWLSDIIYNKFKYHGD